MCEVGDVAAMAEAAKKILSSDQTLAEFKVQAYKTAQKFDIEVILPQYEDLYKKILDK
jgi:glycosyltransferase involved in cell wall biosynthesis